MIGGVWCGILNEQFLWTTKTQFDHLVFWMGRRNEHGILNAKWTRVDLTHWNFGGSDIFERSYRLPGIISWWTWAFGPTKGAQLFRDHSLIRLNRRLWVRYLPAGLQNGGELLSEICGGVDREVNTFGFRSILGSGTFRILVGGWIRG